MTACLPTVVDLCRRCRTHISWPVTGVTESDLVQAYLDGSSTPVPLTLAPDQRTVIGYFAGPDYPTPGAVTVVTGVAVVVVEIISATETNRFDGGMIRVTA